jgi:SAM-dependent methyltransferase
MVRLFRSRVGTAAASLFLAGVAQAQPAAAPTQPGSREECDQANPLPMGRPGKDVVWVPTPDAVVHEMLAIAKVAPQDLVIDLGAGDGRIAIAAARDFGARSLGIEYDPDMAKLAGCLVDAEGAAGKARIVQGDIFNEDFGRATVVTMYLLPDLNVCVRHRLLAMAPGTRVVSHQFRMGEWEPDETAEVDRRSVYLWVVPARVDGIFDFRGRHGLRFSIDLHQDFGRLSGEMVEDGASRPLAAATLRGTEIRFSFEDGKGGTRSFAGTVHGTEIRGVLRGAEDGEVEAKGALRGVLRSAPWAEMPTHCSRYYAR